MVRIVAVALLALSTPAAAQELSCEEELDEVLAELEVHGTFLDMEVGAACESLLDDALDAWEEVHRGVGIDAEPEGAVCAERCSCGYCLRWTRRVELDHVGTYNFMVE